MDYSAKRLKKQRERDQKIAELHDRWPDLAAVDKALRQLTLHTLGQMTHPAFDLEAVNQRHKQLEEERTAILHAHGLDDSIYEPAWDCPRCQDRGFLAPGISCSCRLYEGLLERQRQSGLPADFQTMTFESFQVDYYRNPAEMMDKMKRIHHFVGAMLGGEKMCNLILIGDVGTGKTHLSVAIANEILQNSKTVVYHRADTLLENVRADLFDSSESSSKTMARAMMADLLIIDDLGRESISDFGLTQLTHLIEGRNAAHRPWIITTNLTINELEPLYGRRLQDRMVEKAVAFRLETEESIRLVHRRDDVTFI